MKVGISACSNGHLPEWQDQITELEQILNNMNIETALSPHIIRTIDEYSGTDKERAAISAVLPSFQGPGTGLI